VGDGRGKSKVRLYVHTLQQDDPRKCTSAKLRRYYFAREVRRRSNIHPEAILLNPNTLRVFSPQDRRHMVHHGIVAVDCSWKKNEEVFSKAFPGKNRRLPLLLAANPVNYGHIAKLTSLEALSATLYIGGFKPQAEELLGLFKWAHSFLDLNRALMEDYSQAKNVEEVEKLENLYFRAPR